MWVPSLSCCFVHPKQRLQQQNYYSLCAPALICGVCMQKNDFKTKITSLYGSQTSPEVLCSQNSVLSTRMTSPYRFKPSPVVFCVENSYFSTRITNLYGFLTSSVNLCIQNSVLITRITNLYGSLTSSVVYVCKIVTLRPELKVSMGLRPHLKFCESKSVCLAPEITSLYLSQPSLVASCMQNSDFKDQNYNSVWVTDLICGFCIQYSVLSSRITSLYGS